MKIIELEEKLLEWDARHTAMLINLYYHNIDDVDFIDDIIKLYLKSIELQHATSWLIKYYIDNGNSLSKWQLEKVFSIASSLEHWESKLHVLQLIPQQNIPQETQKAIEPFIKENLFTHKKFVKAAAFQAYYELVKLIPELKNEFRTMCSNAMVNESASVKSKIKRIINNMES